MATSQKIFEAVADALLMAGASHRETHAILSATMDTVGVPALSVRRYRDQPVITALFAARGVRLGTPGEATPDAQ